MQLAQNVLAAFCLFIKYFCVCRILVKKPCGHATTTSGIDTKRSFYYYDYMKCI